MRKKNVEKLVAVHKRRRPLGGEGIKDWSKLTKDSTKELKIYALLKVIYTKYSKHSNETNTFMGLGRAGRFGQS